MQVTFIGGADGVTGSCTLLTDDRIGVRALVDCGAYAERPAGIPDGAPRLPFDARLLDFVVLTHALVITAAVCRSCIARAFVGPSIAPMPRPG